MFRRPGSPRRGPEEPSGVSAREGPRTAIAILLAPPHARTAPVAECVRVSGVRDTSPSSRFVCFQFACFRRMRACSVSDSYVPSSRVRRCAHVSNSYEFPAMRLAFSAGMRSQQTKVRRTIPKVADPTGWRNIFCVSPPALAPPPLPSPKTNNRTPLPLRNWPL